MNNDCEVIRDLLPLYADDICSPKSRELVESHVKGCPECRNIMAKLLDSRIEEKLHMEKMDVLEYGEKWSRVSYGAATGYVKSAFLAFDQPLEAAPQPARVKPSGALMYAAPDAASAPVALLNAGDYALVWPGAGDWRQIEYDGRTGYAPAAGLELSP